MRSLTSCTANANSNGIVGPAGIAVIINVVAVDAPQVSVLGLQAVLLDATAKGDTRYVDKNTKDVDLGNDTRDHFVTNIALASETDGVWTLQDVTNIDSDPRLPW